MPPKKKKAKRNAYEEEKPLLPDPKDPGAQFLGWIKKLGFVWGLAECIDYCESINIDLKNFARAMGKERVLIGISRDGEKVVAIIDRKWASKWARYYGHDYPHHRHQQRYKDPLSNQKQV
jgi:hypothetical protein